MYPVMVSTLPMCLPVVKRECEAKGLMSSEEQVGSTGDKQSGRCEEAVRLREALLAAIRDLNGLNTQQMQSLIDEDPDFSRFDLLVHMANEKKDQAKYALLQHLETHRCEEI
ncbi:MAG: hypothetical protein JWO80_5564 [Bryobacterales bacterium]|nr:hypothetical protein [Bryobacterales bacterium]